MAQYASKTAQPNRDPLPWVDREDGPGNEIRQAWPDGWTEYEPRPEFDHKQHNEPNPILVEFRDVAGTHFPFAEDLAWWLKCLEDPTFDYTANGYRWTLEQVDHARRVLSRLAKLAAPLPFAPRPGYSQDQEDYA